MIEMTTRIETMTTVKMTMTIETMTMVKMMAMINDNNGAFAMKMAMTRAVRSHDELGDNESSMAANEGRLT